tara:strand:+ start:1287 stop:1664 length:378 start_codon:yes stop_codon:yes gene_type:complete
LFSIVIILDNFEGVKLYLFDMGSSSKGLFKKAIKVGMSFEIEFLARSSNTESPILSPDPVLFELIGSLIKIAKEPLYIGLKILRYPVKTQLKIKTKELTTIVNFLRLIMPLNISLKLISSLKGLI